MPQILSLAMFERGGSTLVTKRKAERPPFAGQWLLPGGVVGEDESAEEALEEHISTELGVHVLEQAFAETLYLEDAETHQRFVANIFRVLRFEGELRFRAAGDYEDARWLKRDELASANLPAPLRDWLRGEKQAPAHPGPLAMPLSDTPPDNREAWNTIAKAYQEQKQLPTDRLIYAAHCPGEETLNLLGDVAGLDVIVLGCGGGQDCIVLAKQGARVLGIDLSDGQISFGRKLAEQEDVMVTLLQGNVEELQGIEDESYDLALSLHALNYVEHADRAFAETFRVLRPGSAFVFSVHHPFDACLEDGPPYGIVRGYWEREQDWQWEFPKQRVSARMRSWYRPLSEWFLLLTDAGFRVDRLLEPPPTEGRVMPWDESYDIEKMRLVPANLIVRAWKP